VAPLGEKRLGEAMARRRYKKNTLVSQRPGAVEKNEPWQTNGGAFRCLQCQDFIGNSLIS